MAKSIKQLANDLKLSRSSIETRMNKIPNFRKKYTRKRGNRILISQAGCQLIHRHGLHAVHISQTASDQNNNSSISAILRFQQRTNQHQYAIIQAESQTIHKLTRLLNQQQQLQLSLETENKDLRTRTGSNGANVIKLKGSKPKHHLFKLNRVKLRNFWRRFFGKN